MRVCVIGAGAIGGLVGARLARSGQHLSVLARGENLDVIRSKGLTVVEPDGDTWTTPVAVASADVDELGPQDVIVLALKAHQIAAIADRLPALYDADSVVVPMQNGVPWWFFQRFPGPYDGTRIADARPAGDPGALHSRRSGSWRRSRIRPRNASRPVSSG